MHLQAMRALCAAALVVGIAGCARQPTDIDKFAAELAGGLAHACPMTAPGDVSAHDQCRANIGKAPAVATIRDYSLLWGGDQPGLSMKEKTTTVFRGDLWEDLYLSLYMFTGQYTVSTTPEGEKLIAVQAYFRNALPPGHYPYPFWHTDKKWTAYEKSNEIRLYVKTDGKVRFAGRSDAGSDANRGPYARVRPPAFTGEWMWTDASGAAQPAVTLFSDHYSSDNPSLPALDTAYRKFALTVRNADCLGCHAPDGHKQMKTLTLLQTPLHAASNIEEVLREVRKDKMPLDDHNDPKALKPELKTELLANGEAFQVLLKAADAWERENKRTRKVATR